MSQYITLVGSEEVSRAGYNMRSAADDMIRASADIAASFEAHHRFLDDWLSRLDATLQDRISDLGVTLK